MQLRDAIALHERMSARNPHLVYEVMRAEPSLAEPSFYVRIASRTEPVGPKRRRVGPELAVLARRHAELDAQLELAA